MTRIESAEEIPVRLTRLSTSAKVFSSRLSKARKHKYNLYNKDLFNSHCFYFTRNFKEALVAKDAQVT